MELELYKLEALEVMDSAIDNYKIQLSRISTGRANPNLLNSVFIDYYDTPTKINQIAAISVPEPRQLLIKPFDHSTSKNIATAINMSSLGVTAIDEGHQVRITLPEVTTERRKHLVKQLAEHTEAAKIKVRHGRHVSMKGIKGDEDLNEDDIRYYQEQIQELTDKYIQKIDILTKEKSEDLMTM